MDDVRQPDMFGFTPTQGALFEEPAPPPPKPGHTPESIRALMLGLLAKIRAAEKIPWSETKLRSHTAMFPYMAEWLPDAEGEQLLMEFRAELVRLGAPPRITQEMIDSG